MFGIDGLLFGKQVEHEQGSYSPQELHSRLLATHGGPYSYAKPYLIMRQYTQKKA